MLVVKLKTNQMVELFFNGTVNVLKNLMHAVASTKFFPGQTWPLEGYHATPAGVRGWV